jgi:hypothetical protein
VDSTQVVAKKQGSGIHTVPAGSIPHIMNEMVRLGYVTKDADGVALQEDGILDFTTDAV